MGINLLEVRITDAQSLTDDVIDGFLNEIERLSPKSLDRYHALTALTHRGKFLNLSQAERLCKLFPLRVPDEIILPSAAHAAAANWLHRAQNSFDALMAFLNWAHQFVENDARFAVLRMDAARRLVTTTRTNTQFKLLYTQTFLEPAFSELREEVLRMWEIESLIAIERHGAYMGNLLAEMETFAPTAAVRAKCVELCTQELVRTHEAYT